MRELILNSNFNRGDSGHAGAGYTGASPAADQLVLQNSGTPPLHVSFPGPMPRVRQWNGRYLRPQSALIDFVRVGPFHNRIHSRSDRLD